MRSALMNARQEEVEVLDLRPPLTGNFDNVTAIIAEGVIRIFTNSSEYANEFNTVDYIKNLISKINSTKSPLTQN